MFFYVPPHNNREIPLYFLHKLYVEFMMDKHMNNFDYLPFQVVVWGFPKTIPMLGIEIPINKYLHLVEKYQGQTSSLHIV